MSVDYHPRRYLGFSFVLVVLLCMQVYFFRDVVHLVRVGVADYEVVESVEWWEWEGGDRTVDEILEETGVDVTGNLVTEAGARALESQHRQAIWRGLIFGGLATLGLIWHLVRFDWAVRGAWVFAFSAVVVLFVPLLVWMK